MEGNSNTNTLKNQMQNHPSYLPFFAGDRFYLISDCNDVKEIITKHGGLLVDNIPDSTIIVLGQHQARTKSIKEMVVKERGNGRQPILKEMWILVCDSQNDDVYYDGFLIQTKESDAIPMAAIDSQGEASAHAEEAEISAFKDKDSQLPPHPEAQVQGHHSPEFDSNITADKQNKTANSAARMESTAEVVGIMLGEEMENALVNIWAKHHPEMKKKEIYAELHRQVR
ncbi:hypothetical protein FRC03_005555 [Tulasnella sp. 419]|nr:hypothetical protein FRC03_005555 [Tulasnella sp. 419]